MKQTEVSAKKQDKGNGYALIGAAAFLLAYCVIHQRTDAVRYPWLLSPYLFPAVLSVILGVLGLLLVIRTKRKGR